jgi:hypothetical protein
VAWTEPAGGSHLACCPHAFSRGKSGAGAKLAKLWRKKSCMTWSRVALVSRDCKSTLPTTGASCSVSLCLEPGLWCEL